MRWMGDACASSSHVDSTATTSLISAALAVTAQITYELLHVPDSYSLASRYTPGSESV